MYIALAATHHDPDGRLFDQTARMFPLLKTLYRHIAVFVTPGTVSQSSELIKQQGADLAVGDPSLPTGHLHLGLWRRKALEFSLQMCAADYVHFCDLDWVLHWAEYYPDELRDTLTGIDRYDCTVYGRSERAFASHPRMQTETERLANQVFALVSGLPWDVMAASRSFSRPAAEYIVETCHDDTVGSDCAWPLHIKARGQLSLGYCETEGLEFETGDRFVDEIARMGGIANWIARLDQDAQQWLVRLDLARAEMVSAMAYNPTKEQ